MLLRTLIRVPHFNKYNYLHLSNLKLRVAIIVPRLDLLGPILFVKALVNQLCEIEKIQVKVFYFDEIINPQLKMTVPVEKLDYLRFCFNDYDIIHTNGIRPDLFAFIFHKKIRYHISTIHNFVFDDLASTFNTIISLIYGNLWLILWKRADKLVCISEAMKSYYKKWYSSSKLEAIYNGIEESNNSICLDNDVINKINEFKSKGLKVLGSACILTTRKGIDQILNFIAFNNKYAVVIIGNGKELRNLERLALKLGILNRCLFCGFRSNAVNYFRYFDIFVMPSRSEGFGLALIEAVHQKVPVVCSDLPVFKELFKADEVTFFRLEDMNSLKYALKEAKGNGTKKVESAYIRYKISYLDKIMAENYYRLYQSAETLSKKI